MTTFSHPRPNNITEAELGSTFSRLLGISVTDLEGLGGGRNSQVYKIKGPDGRTYAGKVYFRNTFDSRDRLAVEFGALSFLCRNGIESVPRPLAADWENGLAVYEHIDGRRVVPGEVRQDDMDQAVTFLVRLKGLRSSPGSDQIPPASEACFSLADILVNLERRLARLMAVKQQGESYRALNRFLEQDFSQALDRITGWVQSRLDLQDELDWRDRTLSPSDFGFHNALRVASGRIVWLDFEYFGWDDPAKMAADFLLHPAMALELSACRQFVLGILAGFREVENLSWRLETVYPLFGLKWCLIMLNEFVPTDLVRRGFAIKEELNATELQWRQLAKAQHMLERILDEYENFLYC